MFVGILKYGKNKPKMELYMEKKKVQSIEVKLLKE